jgi:alginate O-acetyltransferase complex protein AlgI
MIFHSYSFLFLFLPVATALFWAAAPRPGLQRFVLVLAGVVFYWPAGPGPLLLLLAMTLVTHAGVQGFASGASPARRRLGVAILALDLLVLAGFKLAGPGAFGLLTLALPLGLSFYTFNLVSYGLDVYRRQAPAAASPLQLASYSTFFPTVSAGPLLRFGGFRPQLETPGRFDAALFEAGVLQLILGLAKKVLIADPLGVAIDGVFAGYETIGALGAWLAVLGYAYQLYFDFSGYTDMARGAAALLGFRAPPNFNAPYAALHITEFWQRWHMSMSQWFRDYLFLPLSRALLKRVPEDRSDFVRSVCLVFTMVVIGFWHGASWSFLAWGLYHGGLLAAHARVRRWRGLSVPAWASRALTFVAVLVGWVLLRSPSPDMAVRLWGAMLGLHGAGVGALTPVAPALGWAVAALFVVTNLPVEEQLLKPAPRGLRSWVLAGLLVLSVLAMGGRSPFLYFQF